MRLRCSLSMSIEHPRGRNALQASEAMITKGTDVSHRQLFGNILGSMYEFCTVHLWCILYSTFRVRTVLDQRLPAGFGGFFSAQARLPLQCIAPRPSPAETEFCPLKDSHGPRFAARQWDSSQKSWRSTPTRPSWSRTRIPAMAMAFHLGDRCFATHAPSAPTFSAMSC